MTAENRVLALERAMQTALHVLAAQGTATQPVNLSEFLAGLYADITSGATVYYRWLEGPAVLFLTADPETFDQAAPEGPGQPTIRKGSAVQLNDLQQVTLSVAEQDSKGQPVSDTLVWSVDNGAVIALTPSADTQSCLCVAGTDGTAVVTVTDNSVTPPLTGTDTLTVVSSAATALVISEGTPEAQPPAAPPA